MKPSFFRHLGLFKAEKETGLPLRVAFAGLWTACDREGRFRWVPEELKLDCLPYDDVDFSRVLDALATRGFVRRYSANGSDYGCVPTFKDHQAINNKESASSLPEPPEINDLTREPRVNDASATPLDLSEGEGKGREGKGKGNGAYAPRELTFWDIGESLGVTRPTIGRMVKDYGEEAVSDAIRNLSLRNKRPADATQYIWGILKRGQRADIYTPA